MTNKRIPTIVRWYARLKFKYKPTWEYGRPAGPFSSKEEAEEYAKSQFGIEKWQTQVFELTEEEAHKMDEQRQLDVEKLRELSRSVREDIVTAWSVVDSDSEAAKVLLKQASENMDTLVHLLCLVTRLES
jgi:hypothetical protein